MSMILGIANRYYLKHRVVPKYTDGVLTFDISLDGLSAEDGAMMLDYLVGLLSGGKDGVPSKKLVKLAIKARKYILKRHGLLTVIPREIVYLEHRGGVSMEEVFDGAKKSIESKVEDPIGK